MEIKKQKWKEPQFTKTQINNAAQSLRKQNLSGTERRTALNIIDNWRASHAYPLHVFYLNLRRQVTSRSDILVVERLKRLDSIISKIERESGMQLYRMQDLGGCRMVVPSLEDVYKYSNVLKESRIRHELKKENDYIDSPKKSGYRSLHLIYRFYTDAPGKEIFNQYPMLIELQYRTHLQHIWATAVETYGLFTKQAIKSGKGSEEIKRFFALVSSLFAIKEECPVVPDTPDNQTELIEEIKRIDKKTHVLESIRAIRMALLHEKSITRDKNGYYLLKLDYIKHKLNAHFFIPSDFEKANSLFDKYENESKDNNTDVVLIRAESFSNVEKAYPNYFMDIGEFLGIVENYMSENNNI